MGKQSHYPSRVRAKLEPWAIRIPVFTPTGRVFDACLMPTTADSLETFTRKGSRFVPDANRTTPTRALRRKHGRPTMNQDAKTDWFAHTRASVRQQSQARRRVRWSHQYRRHWDLHRTFTLSSRLGRTCTVPEVR